MRSWLLACCIPLSLALAGPSAALTPNDTRGFREGANHHLGDDGFVAAQGRRPTAHDAEAARMHAHLAHARRWLGSRPATRPELAGRRAELLAYLDDYIARGTTPENAHLPWRTPVFIDDDGRICAVGYLIERSVGRALPETIAARHRYDLVEDIAASMPAVREWVDASGFTLDELASIQPGYLAPIVETYRSWSESEKPADGPVAIRGDDGETHGRLLNGHLDGAWTRLDSSRHVIGSGILVNGTGRWRSAYADGSSMAEGPLVRDVPHGSWRFFHPSGNLAAEGRFEDGKRAGEWRFYQDDRGHTLIADGSFQTGRVTGVWHHYDAAGKLLAISGSATPAMWGGVGYLLDVVPGSDGVHHWVHEGSQDGNHERLDLFTDGTVSVYVHARDDATYDVDGNALERVDGRWVAKDCHWSAARKGAARAGDIVTLHGLIRRTEYGAERVCAPARPVAADRSKRLDALLASMDRVRSQSPAFVRALVLGQTGDEDETGRSGDLAKLLAAHMTWYVEWPHVDGRFIAVFKTLPGFDAHSPE